MPPPKSPSHRPGSPTRSRSRQSNSSTDRTPTKLSTLKRNEVKEVVAGHVGDMRSREAMPESPPNQINSDSFKAGHERRTSSERTLHDRSDFDPIYMMGSAGSGIVEEASFPVDLEVAGERERAASGGAVSGDTADSNPVDRLREALNAQLLLAQQRDNLTKRLDERERANDSTLKTTPHGRSRVSPIHEETISPSLDAAFASPLPTGMETASTESTRTVRGAYTPSANPLRTPSYPFPTMKPPRQLSFNGHRPFTALSPTVAPQNFSTSFESPHDRVLSGSVTPASTLVFQPGDNDSSISQNHQQFASPNLYELSLQLSAEPGLDAWWTSVVQILRDVFKADRVTLAVPADSTDIENVPWGQKATYNAVEEDEMSLSYLPRSSSQLPSSVDTNEEQYESDIDQADAMHASQEPAYNQRPGLASRHSFTAYEDTKRAPMFRADFNRAPAARRIPLSRSKSYMPTRPEELLSSPYLQHPPLNPQSLQEHIDYENTKGPADWETSDVAAPRDVRGRMFTVLQALDYETDPLIDSSGILRVLERGNVIALTRDYPYIDDGPGDENSGGSKSSKPSAKTSEVIEKVKNNPPELARLSSFLGANKVTKPTNRSVRIQGSEKGKTSISRPYDDLPPILAQRYEEYEQAPPSPWSQSPAPSPAVRTDTQENPFFVNATIDEDTFNPTTTPTDYSKIQEVETIGVDRSLSVLHIPLMHPLLSKPVQSFRLDNAAMEAKSSHKYSKSQNLQDIEPEKEKRIPIAILSILSPIIPYPSTLRHSLEHLAPHLATSFSLCRHFTNLETEVAGLSRKRPHTSGFGAVVPGTQPGDRRARFGNLSDLPRDDDDRNPSAGGSMTSPSDYSGISRSNAGSPAVTPGWDPSSVGLSLDRRPGNSPGYGSGDNYFSPRPRPSAPKEAGQSSASSTRRLSQESSESQSAEPNQQNKALLEERKLADLVSNSERRENQPTKESLEQVASQVPTSIPTRTKSERSPRDMSLATSEQRDTSPSRNNSDLPLSPRRQAMRQASSQSISRIDRPHTQLHSYGADFSSTFQSLPTSGPAVLPGAPRPVNTPRGHTRVGSAPQPVDMPPPSDRLKGLMLDSLPAHVFVALPHTGEIVWVNSRYLTYRGQTVSELYQDPWGSLHPEEREDYLKAWTHALRTGEQFSKQVRIKRFDGSYRWFYTRAVGSRDTRGVVVQWYGSHMDIHEQHIAEVKAARQEEIEASEAKHRLLANLIPQIMFAATEDEGVTFANEQWLSYTGQEFDDALGLGFMDYVHPEDLAKCRIPTDRPPTPMRRYKPAEPTRQTSQTSSGGKSSSDSIQSSTISDTATEMTVKGIHQTLSRQNSSSSDSRYDLPTADLSELARSGIVKVTTDSNGRLSYTTEVRLRSKHGEYRWHLVRCVEVDNINFGSGDGSWFGACTDINDHKLLETKLKEAMESKSKFLSNMSHEIRTPLIGISGMVSFLQDTVLNEEQLDYTNTIQTSANGLLMIINDILDLSKVDAGMMKLSYEWFHTRSLIEDVNELVSTMAISKRLELNYVVDEDVPAMVKGDKVRIRQVLLNVIGNAIKFTAEGEVFSRCRVHHGTQVGENEIMLEYSIVDTGRGFTKEEGELIFKPFSQIDGSSTRQHGGSGLGLVISRQLVELHGGQMEGSAVPGKGSTFTFTAKFGLPTDVDHPEPPPTPSLSNKPLSASLSFSQDTSARALKQAGGNPILANKFIASPSTLSPPTDPSHSPAMASSASSDPSIRSSRTHVTDRSSVSSIKSGLVHFSEAARVGSGDLVNMRLEIPDKTANVIPTQVPTLSRESSGSSTTNGFKPFRPPMYSILVICPQTHSREATTQHIEMTLPKDVPHQITALASVLESQKLIGGEDPVVFTHIVLNLSSAEEIIALMDQIFGAVQLPQTSIVILSDPVQRQGVMKLASEYDYEQLAKDNRVSFVYKPVKPSRFAVIFDPDKERDLSTDRNRSSAQQQVLTQKQNYLDAEKRLGNKGHKVLLVEDNLVNQKVLLKYLGKVGISVDMAFDGVECTEKVFSNPVGFYSLILCDLHMPRKDGYQTCREIREHEKSNCLPRMPIIALSANVMADVLDKCVAAGFNSYVTKPVDFKALSTAMSNLLDPEDGRKEPELLKSPSAS